MTGGLDVFTYFSAIQRDGLKTINKGQKLNFHLEVGQRRPQAPNKTS